MSERPPDPFRAWQDAMVALLRASGPLQGQADLLEETFRAQRDFQAEQARRLLEPTEELVRFVEEAAAPMRTGAEAFEQAAAGLRQAAELLAGQARAIEQASAVMRRQLDVVHSIVGGAPPAR